MAKGNEEITAWKVYGRLVRKLARPGVLPALIESRRLDHDTADSLGNRVSVAAETWPDRPAVKFEGRQLTWREFNDTANQYAHALADIGVGRGDVVVVNVVNRPEMLLAMTAAMKLGAISALVNTGLTGESLAHSMRVAKPRAVIVGEEQLDAVATIDGHQDLCDTWVFVGDDGTRSVPEGWIDLDEAHAAAPTHDLPVAGELTLGTPAVYIYTSGTTGLPKAAVTPHARLRMGGLLIGRVVLEMSPDDTMYCALPLYHSTGLMGAWAACVHTGASLALARRFSATEFWDDIRRYDATSFNYVGEVLRFLMNQPPRPEDRQHRVRGIYGAGLRPEIWDEFKSRFGIERIHEVWGASESPSGFLNILNFDRTVGWNPSGWKLVAYDTQREQPVRGPDGFLQEVGKGGTGLLVMKIDKHQRFEGYTDDGATNAKILRDVFEPGDAWFDSGDLMHNLGHGHLRFIDRTGDTYRWRGENVATTQVEAVADAWPQLAQTVSYGVEVPDTEGRCGMVLLIPHEGERLDLDGFAAHLRAELPAFAVPRFLRIATQVAVTGTFKVQKVSLRDAAYDLDRVDDPLYLLAPDAPGPVTLTKDLVSDIESGKLRL